MVTLLYHRKLGDAWQEAAQKLRTTLSDLADPLHIIGRSRWAWPSIELPACRIPSDTCMIAWGPSDFSYAEAVKLEGRKVLDAPWADPHLLHGQVSQVPVHRTVGLDRFSPPLLTLAGARSFAWTQTRWRRA